MAAKPTNNEIADLLEKIAGLLETEETNPFRIRAYQEGAQMLRELDRPVADLVRGDQMDELIALPTIGEGIAAVIGEYVSSGKSSLLEQLESKISPADVFARVPGIGLELAQRILDHLDIQTLPELEEAAHDGRLATVEGFGKRRVEAVRTSLAGMLSQSARRQQRNRTTNPKSQNGKETERPSVELLLDIDEEYRRQAEGGKLRKIAPRRFNPEGKAWLPVLRKKRDGWNFTALYSNTAQAHELGKTDDWVVIYYEQDGKQRQNTVVTETQGELKGRRVVRGRSLENKRYYEASAATH